MVAFALERDNRRMKSLLLFSILMLMLVVTYNKKNKNTFKPDKTVAVVENKKLTSTAQAETEAEKKIIPISFHLPENHEPHASIEFDPAWDENLYEFLVDSDPENADRIFKEYQIEKNNYALDIERNLVVSFQSLSELNGHSKEEEEMFEESSRKPANLSILELSHQKRIKEILGEHFEPLNTQYELHIQRSENPLE